MVVHSFSGNEEQISRDFGSAAAFLLESFIKAGQLIGISSWSGALLEMINHMHPSRDGQGMLVVQILGGLGNPAPDSCHIPRAEASRPSSEAPRFCFLLRAL
ncbi:sugar-binding domain-containing protein [Edaphobacter sp. 12200R-103]|uniref:sugar-binding domain-containing protein n=1 Tax=Edaphobacter sp. 12200R-103 TaxID=2703788 RepID=UPI00351BAC2A